MFQQNLAARLLLNEEWFFCINTNEWEHYFEEDNYVSIKTLGSEKAIVKKMNEMPFIKIAAKISLQQLDDAEIFFLQKIPCAYSNISCPAGEINLSPGIPIVVPGLLPRPFRQKIFYH